MVPSKSTPLGLGRFYRSSGPPVRHPTCSPLLRLRIASLVSEQGQGYRGSPRLGLLSRQRQHRDPLVRFGYQEIEIDLDLDNNVAATLGWRSLMDTPRNCKRLAILVAIPSGLEAASSPTISTKCSRPSASPIQQSSSSSTVSSRFGVLHGLLLLPHLLNESGKGFFSSLLLWRVALPLLHPSNCLLCSLYHR